MCYNQTYDHSGKYHNGANSTLMRYNGGGGIVIVYGASSVKIDGEVSARGGDGNVMTVIEGRPPLSGVQRTYLGSGGGAGGTIVCATTKSVLGKGNFTAAGGRGGGRHSPGAGAAYTPTNYSGGGGGEARYGSIALMNPPERPPPLWLICSTTLALSTLLVEPPATATIPITEVFLAVGAWCCGRSADPATGITSTR